MYRRRVVLVLGFLCTFVAPAAHAFFDPPWITPAAPRVGEVVSVDIRDGICDAIFEHAGFPQITRQGNSIRLLEYGHHWDSADLCIYDTGHLAEPIGAFPRGDYAVTVDFTYDNYPFGYETITLGVVPFTVVGATSTAAVPVISTLWKFVLLVVISGIAARALQMRQRSKERLKRLLTTWNRSAPIFVALLLAMMSPSAQAFFDPPWITPPMPRAGEPIFLNVHGGTCDVFVERPGYPQVTRSGNDIRIVEYGNRETFDDFCNYGIWTVIEPIGIFLPGAYTLTVDFTYENYPFGYETLTLGVGPFTVVGATLATPVPVVSPLWKFTLLVLISSIVAWTLQVRRSRLGS